MSDKQRKREEAHTIARNIEDNVKKRLASRWDLNNCESLVYYHPGIPESMCLSFTTKNNNNDDCQKIVEKIYIEEVTSVSKDFVDTIVEREARIISQKIRALQEK